MKQANPSDYVWTTHWHFPDAPVEAVWQLLADPRTWPRWWPHVVRVTRVAGGDGDGVGVRHRFVWCTRLPYRIAFETQTTAIEPHQLLAARACGEVDGEGVWRLAALESGGTRVEYTWSVRLTSGWKRLLAVPAAPVFKWNHDGVMRAGETGMKRYLSGRAA